MAEQKLSTYFQQLEFDEKLNKTWSAFFIDRTRLILLIIAMIFIAGYISMSNLPLESQPEVKIGMASVVTTYPGATPAMMEDLVTKKIEKQIGKIKGIDTITSSSRQSASVITVQFLSNADTDKGMQDLRDKVSSVSDLPDDANTPTVTEISMDDTPVWVFAISGDYNGFDLYEYGKKIKDELEKNTQVSEVSISGGDESEIQVTYDPQKLETYGLSFDTINSLLKSYNIAFPLGDTTVNNYTHNITVDSRFYDIDTIRNLPIGKVGTTGIVYMKDVANIVSTNVKRTNYSFLSENGSKPKNAVTMSVVKKPGGSIVDLVAAGNAMLKQMHAQNILPANLKFTTITDTAEKIKTDLSQLLHDGILTVILVFLVLFAVIGIQEAFVAGTAVPLVFFMTFTVMYLGGQTLNFLSMFALILALGLLVDDAIVVISAINQYKKTGKFTTREAALLVLQDFNVTLISTTLTVVWIFSAMLFMTGIIGKFIFSIPFVVTITLLSSLLVALTINPALSVMLDGLQEKLKHVPGIGYIQKGFIHFGYFEDIYEKALEWIIAKKYRSWGLVIGGISLVLASLLLPALGFVKMDFFPKTNQDTFYVNMEAEAGTSLDKMATNVEEVETLLQKEKGIKSFATEIGKISQTSKLSGGSSATHYATITVNLYKEKEGRVESSLDITERLRSETKHINYMKVSVVELSSGPGSGSDLEIKIAGENFDTMDKIAADVKKIVQTLPGALNVETSKKALPLEFQLTFDKGKLQFYDIPFVSAVGFLRNAIDGAETTSIFSGNDEIKVRTKYVENATETLDAIKHIVIKNAKGQSVFIGDLLSANTLTPATQSISRVDQERVIAVTAAADKTTNGTQLLAAFQKASVGYKLPDGYKFIIGGSNEQSNESIMSLFTSMQFGMLLILATLIVLFDSFRQSFLVMMTIPLSLIGVFVGLALFNQPLSFPGMIGMVALFGIVVRNGIILFDKINMNRNQDIGFEQSIIDGGKSRLEPILLTSLCTIVGIIPITFTNPTWTSLGLAIIFGLLFSTFSTLLTLPVLYSLLVPKKWKKL